MYLLDTQKDKNHSEREKILKKKKDAEGKKTDLKRLEQSWNRLQGSFMLTNEQSLENKQIGRVWVGKS